MDNEGVAVTYEAVVTEQGNCTCRTRCLTARYHAHTITLHGSAGDIRVAADGASVGDVLRKLKTNVEFFEMRVCEATRIIYPALSQSDEGAAEYP